MKTQLQLFLLNSGITVEQTMKPISASNMFYSLNSLFNVLWLCVLCIFSSGVIYAQTDVSGTIVNQTWTSNGSPYIVVGDINVAGLTILPGVTVQFASNYAFEVDGVLQAQGTPNAPIIFTGTNGGWQGIFFNYSSPGSVLACCVISNSVNSGINISNSTPMIANCVVANNSAPGPGGGININQVTAGGILLENCTITNNTCFGPGAGGGGVCCQGAPMLEMDGCIVSGNVVDPPNPGTPDFAHPGTFVGGGIAVWGNALLRNCVVEANVCFSTSDCNGAQAQGGGIRSDLGNLEILNCIVSSNVVAGEGCICGCYDAVPTYGGGVFVNRGSLNMTNSIISWNQAETYNGSTQGGGVFIFSDVQSSSIVNCTVAYNNIEGIYSQIAAAQVMNSIVYFNTTQMNGPTNVTYCDVQGGWSGEGNINFNPIFLSSDNLIIVPGSPCIDAGNTNAAYNDLLFPPSLGTQLNDMGAHGGPTAGARMAIQAWPQIEVFLYGGAPDYSYVVQASTNLINWQTVEQFQIAHLGDIANYLEPTTNTLSQRFYRLNLTQ